MTNKTTRRAALGALAAVAASPAAALAEPAGNDPFVVALAKYRECDAILDAHLALPPEELDDMTPDEYHAPYHIKA
jgi:hypothetical protein